MRFAIGAFALLALSGNVSAQCDGTCQCEIDDCFEVLAGTLPFPPQPRISDCRDFLWEHSTWGSQTSTITSYVTNGVVTEIVSETVISTVSEGTTTLETVTNTVTESRTITSGAGSFTGEPITTVIAPLRRRRRKRQNSVPSYASDCGGPIGYSSACTCIGVSPDGTLWTEVPTATTTVTSTVASTETASETETITTTVEGDFAGSTETSTLVKTATQEVTQPLYTPFVLQLTNDAVNGVSKGYFLRFVADPANSNLRRLQFTANVEDATLYKADDSGVVTTNTGGLGFAHDQVATGPGMWQESAAGKSGWLDYTCTINEDKLLFCNSAARTFLAFDPNDGRKLRAFGYLYNILNTGCSGPLIIAAVPQDTTTIAPAVAKNVVIQASAGTANGIYANHYLGQQNQDSQPFPRVRFYQSINDAVVFKVDPVNGNMFGPNNAPFSAAAPTTGSPTPFLLGNFDTTRRVQHVHVQWPALSVQIEYPGEDRYLGAVIVDGTDPSAVPYFRTHSDQTMLPDEQGPLELQIVEV
ncbi:uncharacterized protein DFL_000322 [Arthrobotrys flagrans]|uniref:Uncharacterized protein n=1 Tax=Arthrobotrys flagrans TaxID=97331 RepID=A0A437ADV7_ARTFL|nr:hypothetical protein DFL_000322 [Arthrobotrys flagrans]